MTKNYTQLSLDQRYQIEALRYTGMRQKSIVQAIGVHASTVCRELRRNTPFRVRNEGTYAAQPDSDSNPKTPSTEGQVETVHGGNEVTGFP